MHATRFRTALVLGLLSAIGPFAIDMYLPALPAIRSALAADIGAVQASLMGFFVALGAAQLLWGPISDMVGRKPPLYVGLGLFAIASVGCALATSIEALVAMRAVQGFGAAVGMAVPRAVVRDLHTGTEAARLMSLLMLVFSVSPILAPLVGSVVIQVAGWRAVFWLVAACGAAGLLLTAFTLRETRPAHQRLDSTLRSALASYSLLLRDSRFLGLVFVGAFGMAGFFTYLANASFVMIEYYRLTPLQFGLAFGVNAAGFFGASQLAAPLAQRYGMAGAVRWAMAGSSLALLVLLGIYLAGHGSLPVLIGLFLVSSAFLGIVIPSTAVLALEQHGTIAGTASALMGTLQMLTGALAMQVTGLYMTGEPLPMVAGMAVFPFLALLLALVTLGPRHR